MKGKQRDIRDEINEQEAIILSDREALANKVYEGKASKWEEELFFMTVRPESEYDYLNFGKAKN